MYTRPGREIIAFFVVAGTVVTGMSVSAQSSHVVRDSAEMINQANGLLRDGKIDEAIDAYRKVVPGEHHRDELKYNTAVAEFRKGNIDVAQKLFAEVAGSSTSAIAVDSRYNLGNCRYATALQNVEHDRPAAIKQLRDAISNYRAVLREKPSHSDARANTELAGELIRKLEQEQEQKKEPQKQEDQAKENDQQQQDQKSESEQQRSDKKESDEQAQRDQDDAQRKDSQQKSDDQDSKQQDSEQQDSEQQDSEQQDSEQQNSEQQNKDDQSGTVEQADKSQGNEEQDSDGTGSPENQDAAEQPVPEGDLEPGGRPAAQKDQEGNSDLPEPRSKMDLMTREEALKMLQSVRDRDMLRRMRLERRERSRRVPVEKDW